MISESYDLFLSYSRKDTQLCGQIKTLLEDFGLKVFFDQEMPGGILWEQKILSVLRQEKVNKFFHFVILISDHAYLSEWVIKEARLAIEAGASIIPIMLSAAKTGELYDLIGHHQFINATDCVPDQPLPERIKDALWRSIHIDSTKLIEGSRKRAMVWAQSLVTPVEDSLFWGFSSLKMEIGETNAYSSLALIGPSGSGKSVALARNVLEMGDDMLPIILERNMLSGDLGKVARVLGSPSLELLTEHLGRIEREFKTKPVLIIDALDTYSEKDMLRILPRLVDCFQTVMITCIADVWKGLYAIRLNIKHREMPVIPDIELLKRVPEALALFQNHQLLRLPVFVDLYTRHQKDEVLMSSQGIFDFLSFVFSRVESITLDSNKYNPTFTTDVRQITNRLTQIQYRQGYFEVILQELERACRDVRHFDKTLDKLEQERYLIRRNTSQGMTIRWRHDLLDGFGIVRYLMSRGITERQSLYGRAEAPFGYPVLTLLVKISHERNQTDITREVFEQLLYILDRKYICDDYMYRSWTATTVLITCQLELQEKILACLGGVKYPSLDKDQAHEGERRSRLNPEPGCTQEAASSLASVFRKVPPREAPDPETAVPIFVEGLNKFSLRARFIDALCLYLDRREVCDALTNLAVRELAGGLDPFVLKYLCEAFGRRIKAFEDIASAIARA